MRVNQQHDRLSSFINKIQRNFYSRELLYTEHSFIRSIVGLLGKLQNKKSVTKRSAMSKAPEAFTAE